MTIVIDDLYASHLARVTTLADAALEASGHDDLLIYSGTPKYDFRDDHGPRFVANHQLKLWLPLGNVPDCWLHYAPGSKPKLSYFQPADYWHLPPADPDGVWTQHIDVDVTAEPKAIEAVLTRGKRTAVLGELPEGAVAKPSSLNPSKLVNYLDYHRAYKSDYELACMARASELGVAGHQAARNAFLDGASEFDIHMRYCAAVGQREQELPYGNIIAINEHGAVLHYHGLDQKPPTQRRSFLIDAGAHCRGYASDITRTYSLKDDEFREMIAAMDEAQQRLGAGARAGVDYADLHLEAHREVAQVLRRFRIVDMDPEECVSSGVSGTFLPHGLGHLLGLQVHDVGGLQGDVDGGTIDRPQGHPFLRLTRTLEPGMTLTIEPGVYFVDMLLDELASGEHAKRVDWERVESFKPYGGIRIEDNVAVTESTPKNLTREAFARA